MRCGPKQEADLSGVASWERDACESLQAEVGSVPDLDFGCLEEGVQEPVLGLRRVAAVATPVLASPWQVMPPHQVPAELARWMARGVAAGLVHPLVRPGSDRAPEELWKTALTDLSWVTGPQPDLAPGRWLTAERLAAPEEALQAEAGSLLGPSAEGDLLICLPGALALIWRWEPRQIPEQ